MTESAQEKKTKETDGGHTEWFRAQEEMLKSWQKDFSSAAEEWRKFWPQAPQLTPGADFSKQWNEQYAKSLEEFIKHKPAGIGAEVFEKVLSAGTVYLTVLDFWKNAIMSSALTSGFPDPEKIEEFNKDGIKHYEEVMKALWGKKPTAGQKEIIDSLGRMLKVQAQVFSEFGAPVLEDLKQISEKTPHVLQGDQQKMREIFGILRKDYDQTMGKLFNLPAMGFFSQIQDRTNQVLDSYNRYRNALGEYYAVMYQTSIKGMEKVLSRVEQFKDEDWCTKESAKKLYRLWMTINEDTFRNLFVSPQFIALLKEVLTRGLLFRKNLEEFLNKLIENTPFPNKRDMDEVYKSLYDLRKELRALKKEVDVLRAGRPEQNIE